MAKVPYHHSKWQPQHIELLRQLWPTTHAKVIVPIMARHGLVVTRNAVIGKAHRLGMYKGRHRGPVKNIEPEEETIKAPKPIVFRPPPKPRPIYVTKTDDRVSLLVVKDHACRFMTGERGEDGHLLVCGKPPHNATSAWCEEHLRVMYRPPGSRMKFEPSPAKPTTKLRWG